MVVLKVFQLHLLSKPAKNAVDLIVAETAVMNSCKSHPNLAVKVSHVLAHITSGKSGYLTCLGRFNYVAKDMRLDSYNIVVHTSSLILSILSLWIINFIGMCSNLINFKKSAGWH